MPESIDYVSATKATIAKAPGMKQHFIEML